MQAARQASENLIGCFLVGVFEPVHDRFIEEYSVLGNNANMTAKRINGIIFDVLAVDLHTSTTDIVETEEHTKDSRSATTRISLRSCHRSGFTDEI